MISILFALALIGFIVCQTKLITLRGAIDNFIGKGCLVGHRDLTAAFFWKLDQINSCRKSKRSNYNKSEQALLEQLNTFPEGEKPAIIVSSKNLERIFDSNSKAKKIIDSRSLMKKLQLLSLSSEEYINCQDLVDKELSRSGVRCLIKLSFILPIPRNKESLDSQVTLWCLFTRECLCLMQNKLLAEELKNNICVKFDELKELSKYKKNIAESRRSHLEKSQLISGLSHDLRSPLNNLQVVNNLLKDDPNLSAEQKELFDLNQVNLRMIKSLIEDLLSISSYRAGKFNARPELIEPDSIINSLLGVYRLEAEIKNLKLDFESDISEVKINFDPLHFKRILNNLVFNAIKYTSAGRVLIKSTVAKNKLKISIIDSGSGISEDQIKLLCRPFHRCSDQEIKGFGLGLSVTKILLKINHGDLKIQSKIGKGSEFILEFPELSS